MKAWQEYSRHFPNKFLLDFSVFMGYDITWGDCVLLGNIGASFLRLQILRKIFLGEELVDIFNKCI